MSLAPGAPIYLASGSPTRKRLLEAAGIPVVVEPAAVDEGEIKAAFQAERRSAEDCATALAEAKAMRVSLRHPDALVIGADQMLDCNGVWFDKPRDLAHARAHLMALRGKRHRLISAVAVLRAGAVLWHAIDQAELAMRPFSDDFLHRYLAAAGGAALHSVGAYQLEGLGAQLFTFVDGDYFTILGLPLLPLLDFLRGHGALAA
ncbi:MAG TPA: nucleoside triphosphate pyrophosphatase [Stellaceae bacterium]|nr:nucleoside triphosphate pyrophosphatase [Stellaceae bacterium]